MKKKPIDILYLVYPSMIGLMSNLSGVKIGEFPFYENAMNSQACSPPWGAVVNDEDIDEWIDTLKGRSNRLYLSVSVIEPQNIPKWCINLSWRKALAQLAERAGAVVIIRQTKENFIYDGISVGLNGPDLLRTWTSAESVMHSLAAPTVCDIGANRLSTKKGMEILKRHIGVTPVMQNPQPRNDQNILKKVHNAVNGKESIELNSRIEAEEKHIIRREMFSTLKGGDLGMVAVYFNACGYKKPLNNFKNFIKRFEGSQDDLLIVELAFNDQPFNLTGLAENTLQLRSNTILWQKEALINAGTRVLRERGYENVGWLDGDTVIDGPVSRWWRQCSDALKNVKLVQCFDTITQHFDNTSIKATGALSEYRNTNPDPWSCYACGGSWAVRGDVWDECEWYDYGIAGSGDRLMFIASLDEVVNLSRHAEMCGKDQTHLNFYKKWVAKWRASVDGSVDYTEGVNFASEAHGKTTTRNYRSRAEELIRIGYEPKHVLRDVNGVFRWSESAPQELKDFMQEYFNNRQEDG